MILRKNLPITSTILDLRQDEPGDLKQWAPYSRFRLMEQTWKKMLKAGVRLGYGSGADAGFQRPREDLQHRLQLFPRRAERDVSHLRQLGSDALYTLRMATTVNAEIIHWQDKVGAIEKGKFADLIATSGDPLENLRDAARQIRNERRSRDQGRLGAQSDETRKSGAK